MESIKNKYGSIIVEKTEQGDLSFSVFDENGVMPRNRKEARELEMKIVCEDRRDAKADLLDLMSGGCVSMTQKALEMRLKEVLDRIGVPLYHNGVIRDFCDVFDDIAFALEGVE